MWLVLGSGPAFAQVAPSGPRSLPPQGVFRSTVELVTLNVSVTDDEGKQVPDLSARDFAVYEDGVPQEISFFSASMLPLDVAILVDTSSSMLEKIQFVREAATRFVRQLRPIDRATIVEFNSQVRTLQPLTSDHQALEAAIQQTKPRGGTLLYTALYVALHGMAGNGEDSGSLRRPAIVVLTDGEDNGSLVPYDDVLERVRQSGVAIYTISVISATEAEQIKESGGRRFLAPTDYSLKEMAQESGGLSFFPLALSELSGVYTTVANELATQYALGYTPARPVRDGSYRHVVVRVVTHPGARPRTRSGYFAAKVTRASNGR